MFFPWVGLFEQLRLADVFVHYDDVQLPQGRTFITRVQLKGADGVHWLTMPVQRGKHLARINDTNTSEEQNWRQAHLKTLRHMYAKTPFCKAMLDVVELVYSMNTTNVAALNAIAIEHIAAFFDLECDFRTSSRLGISGASSQRLLELVQRLDGTVYVTGHGARNYLDHELFDASGVRVEYMRYNQTEYNQLYGSFTPFVSILDLMANEGKDGRRVIASPSIYWKDFIT